MRDYLAHPVPQGTAIEAWRAVRTALAGDPMPILTRNATVIRYLAGMLANHMTGSLAHAGWDDDAAEAAILEYADKCLASLILGEAPDGTPMLMDPAAWEGLPQD